MSDEVDVVIVGGGAVGLWLACELALAKVKVMVLERQAKPATQSRTMAIYGRTLETLALRGLADRFLAHGRPIPSGHFGVLDKSADFPAIDFPAIDFPAYDFPVFDRRFPFLLLLPQRTIEAIFEERLQELGVPVKRGHLVETVEQQGDEVVIGGVMGGVTTVDGADSFSFSARYVIGTDGARSVVRMAAGIEFSASPARYSLMLGDVVLDAPPKQQVLSILNDAGGLLAVPLGDGIHHRLVVMNAAKPHAAPSVPVPSVPVPSVHVPLAELAAAATCIAGRDFRPRDPIWLSRFADEAGLADSYRRDRVLLAGNAAHIHASMGGQGLNVGIQDAMNLGWKLASVLRGAGSPHLLDSYESERRPIGEAVCRSTLAQLALFTTFDPSAIALGGTLDDFLRVPEVNLRLTNELSGFGVAYPQPLFPPQGGWQHRSGVSGHRLPDMDLTLKDGSHTTLYQLLERGSWVQLKLSAETETFPGTHAILVVHLNPRPQAGLPADAASILIRPDGYIAHIRPLADLRKTEAAA